MTTAPAIYRYEVPVDDQWHSIPLQGAVWHVAARRPDAVEIWALHKDMPPRESEFRVFGTGQPLPDEPLAHVGTAIVPGSPLVWHLLERK